MPSSVAKIRQGVAELYEEAMQLPADERRMLAERLLESLEAEPESSVQRAWSKEASRRLDEVRAGRSQPAPWAEARTRIFAGH